MKMMNENNLVKLRRMFMTMTALLIVFAVYDIYTLGIKGQNIFFLILASMMFNFANKAESAMLKLKIDKMISKHMEMNDGELKAFPVVHTKTQVELKPEHMIKYD